MPVHVLNIKLNWFPHPLGYASEPSEPVTEEDLFLLVDLFYTPFAHGSRGLHLLFEFEWLKCNAYLVEEAKGKKEPTKEVYYCPFPATAIYLNTFRNY